MAEEIIFNTRVNTGNSVEELKKIDKELGKIDKSADKVGGDVASKFEQLNQRIEKGGLSVRDYSKAIREYQSIALEAGRTSPVGIEALNRAASMQDQIGDLRNEVSRLAHDGKNMQGALQVGSAVTAGYGAMQGVMALVGAESEDLQKTMVKLTAITSVLNGIEQIRTALEKESAAVIFLKNAYTKTLTITQTVYTAAVGKTTGAMKALKISMLALPIVALIAGVVAVVAALSAFSDDTEKAERVTRDFDDALNDLADSFEFTSKVMDDHQKTAINNMKLRGATDKEILKQEKKNAQDRINAEWKKTEEIIKATNKVKNSEFATIEALEKANKEGLKAWQQQQHLKRQALLLTSEFQLKEKELTDKATTETLNRNAKANENAKKRRDERIATQKELQKTLEDLAIANIADEETREIARLKLAQEREAKELRAKFGANTQLEKDLLIKQQNELNDLQTTFAQKEQEEKDAEAQKLEAERLAKIESENLSKKAELEGKLIQMRDDFEQTQALLREQAEMQRTEALANVNLTEGERFKIEQEYSQKIQALDQAEADSEIAKNEAIQASRQSLLTAVAGVFGQLAGLAKEGSKQAKALALVEIAINTGVGFVQGLRIAQQSAAATGPGAAFAFPIFYAQQLAAVLGAAKQAKSILGAGGGIQAPSVPQTQNAGQGQQAQGNNTVTETQSNLTAGLQNNAQKVFVVDSEISMIQNNTRRAEAVSTIG